jgi:hypothetical protein
MYGSYPTKFAASIQNLKKIIEKSIKSTNQNEKFPKKICLVPQKSRGAKNSYRGYPTEFAGSTQNQINQSE